MSTSLEKIVLFILGACMGTLLGGTVQAASNAGNVWGANYFPNIELTSHQGEKLLFFDDLIKDKVVVINFIFTRCPDACPLETARLREVQALLEDRVGKDIFFYSISIEPEHDTPEVLNDYVKRFQIGPGWLFLTGKSEEITLLRSKLGLLGLKDDPIDLKAHNINMVIGNQKSGKWMKMSPLQNPYILANQIGSWLHNWKMPSRKNQDYAQAPQIRGISKGESLFRTRCASCHAVGSENAGSAKSGIGPDLLGVTRNREAAWLRRYIAAPDKMIAEKDPLALSLLKTFDGLPMPNLQLNSVEVEALITYLDEETERQENVMASQAILQDHDAHQHHSEHDMQQGQHGTHQEP